VGHREGVYGCLMTGEGSAKRIPLRPQGADATGERQKVNDGNLQVH
jgi:hypothetical protein